MRRRGSIQRAIVVTLENDSLAGDWVGDALPKRLTYHAGCGFAAGTTNYMQGEKLYRVATREKINFASSSNWAFPLNSTDCAKFTGAALLDTFCGNRSASIQTICQHRMRHANCQIILFGSPCAAMDIGFGGRSERALTN